MEIYLIRHTKPAIESNICYGNLDILVSKTYEIELEIILKKLPKNIQYIYSSPLIRCKTLAVSIANYLNIGDTSLEEDGRLKEINFGNWEGKNWDDIDKNELDIWMTDFVNVKTTNGESYLELYSRSVSFMQNIYDNHKHNFGPILIVTHAGFIRSVLSYVQKIDLKNSFDIKINYGDIVRIKYINENNIEINSNPI